ncbi:Deleted in lung and esophageal cancer protein 1 [Allomyces javanicus]|nr:Deleted in lung and esophageal cancer protein 1 [Allomyces javanicus]
MQIQPDDFWPVASSRDLLQIVPGTHSTKNRDPAAAAHAMPVQHRPAPTPTAAAPPIAPASTDAPPNPPRVSRPVSATAQFRRPPSAAAVAASTPAGQAARKYLAQYAPPGWIHLPVNTDNDELVAAAPEVPSAVPAQAAELAIPVVVVGSASTALASSKDTLARRAPSAAAMGTADQSPTPVSLAVSRSAAALSAPSTARTAPAPAPAARARSHGSLATSQRRMSNSSRPASNKSKSTASATSGRMHGPDIDPAVLALMRAHRTQTDALDAAIAKLTSILPDGVDFDLDTGVDLVRLLDATPDSAAPLDQLPDPDVPQGLDRGLFTLPAIPGDRAWLTASPPPPPPPIIPDDAPAAAEGASRSRRRHQPSPSPTPAPSAPARIAVTPSSILFTSYTVHADHVYAATITATNTSPRAASIQIDPASSVLAMPQFHVARAPGSGNATSLVAPGMSVAWTVLFRPDSLAQVHASLVVAADGGGTAVTVPVVARRDAPVLMGVPDRVEVPACWPGEVGEKVVVIENTGGAGTFTFAVDPPSARISVSPTTLILAAGDRAAAAVRYAAPDVPTNEETATVHVACDNGASHVFEVTARAETPRVDIVDAPEPGAEWTVDVNPGAPRYVPFAVENPTGLHVPFQWRICDRAPRPMTEQPPVVVVSPTDGTLHPHETLAFVAVVQCTDLDPIDAILSLDVPGRKTTASLASITLHAVPRAFDLGITPCAIHVPGILPLGARYTSRVRVANRSVTAVRLVWTSENVPDQVLVWSVDWDEAARVDPGDEVELDVVGRARWPGVLDRTANAALVCAAFAVGGGGAADGDEDASTAPVWSARLPMTAVVGDLAAHPVMAVEPAMLELDAVPLGEAAVASLTVTNTHATRAIAWHLVAPRGDGYILALDPPRGVLAPDAAAHVRAALVPFRAGCVRGQVQCRVAPWMGAGETSGADEDDERAAVVALAVPFAAVCDVPAFDVGVISAADNDDDEAVVWAAAGNASVNVSRVFAGAPPMTACTIAMCNRTAVPAEFRIRVASDLDEDTEITINAPDGWVPAGATALVAISVAAARVGARVAADLLVTCPGSTRAVIRLTGARAAAAELVCDAASTGVNFGDLAVLDPAETVVTLRNPANAPVAFELAVVGQGDMDPAVLVAPAAAPRSTSPFRALNAATTPTIDPSTRAYLARLYSYAARGATALLVPSPSCGTVPAHSTAAIRIHAVPFHSGVLDATLVLNGTLRIPVRGVVSGTPLTLTSPHLDSATHVARVRASAPGGLPLTVTNRAPFAIKAVFGVRAWKAVGGEALAKQLDADAALAKGKMAVRAVGQVEEDGARGGFRLARNETGVVEVPPFAMRVVHVEIVGSVRVEETWHGVLVHDVVRDGNEGSEEGWRAAVAKVGVGAPAAAVKRAVLAWAKGCPDRAVYLTTGKGARNDTGPAAAAVAGLEVGDDGEESEKGED